MNERATPAGPSAELLASETRFREFIELDSDAILVLGRDGRVRHANPAAGRLFECATGELLGRNLGLPVLSNEGARVTLPRPSGRSAVCELSVLETRWRGEPVHMASLRDVTRHARAETALRVSEERYALAARAANDGLWDWNLETDSVYYSPRWRAILGSEEAEVGTSVEEWFGRVHEDDIERVRAAVRAHIDGLSDAFQAEYRMRHAGGGYRWVLCRGLAVRDDQGRATRMAGSQTDVTHRKLAEEQLAHRAFYDPLTNLPNRALFLDRLRHSVRRANRRPDYQFAVLFLDVDRFKTVNDSLGHLAGDRLLVMIARRLELSLRPGDTVARLGGDEFTILLDDTADVADATRVAERILFELQVPFNLGGQEIFAGASIGIALSATGYEKPEDILRDADSAMYRAKAGGRMRHALFDQGLHDDAVALLQTEADLRRALEREELEVWYQPIVSLELGRITGVEALVRWRHATRGLIPPNEFIPLAEETGLIVPIGRFVLEAACRTVHAWRSEGGPAADLEVSVNLSGRQFALPDLVEQVAEVLRTTELHPRALRLEITESMLMEDPEAVTVMLEGLRGLGVRLSIDDFGTGYSSLAYLQRFPVDVLKIDRSFVTPMGEDGENSEIARTIVTIGHNLGMSIVAEGVESPLQLDQLRALACESAQGFLFARPLEPGAARDCIREDRRW